MIWKLCLASLLAASASGLRGRGLIDFGRSRKKTATASQTCGPFPGQQVVMVTANKDFMPFFQNWLGYAGSFLTSFEQVVVVAEDAEVVPMLRGFLHNGTRTPFKIAILVKNNFKEVTAAADHHSSDIYKIRTQDNDPYFSEAYVELVSQRPREILHFLEQNCTVLYTDIDTAWLQNPFDAISRVGDYEIYVTDDSNKHGGKGIASNYLCSCFLYMHPTSNVKALIRVWASQFKSKLHHNQRLFNTAFHKMYKRRPDFAGLLPREEFPPGCEHSDHPTVLHANYIMGEEKKKEFLKKHGAWSLP